MLQAVHTHLEDKTEPKGSLESMSMRMWAGRSNMVVHAPAAADDDDFFVTCEMGWIDLLPLLFFPNIRLMVRYWKKKVILWNRDSGFWGESQSRVSGKLLKAKTKPEVHQLSE